MGKLLNFLKRLFSIKCGNCGKNSVNHSHSELINTTWIEIYECSNCKTKFV